MRRVITASKFNWFELLADENLQRMALTGNAVIVYSGDLEKIMWANASGAKLFGGSGIDQFMTADFSSAHPFIRQLKSAARQLEGDKLYRGFRIVDEGRSRLLQCEIEAVELSDQIDGVMVSCANPAMENLAEHEIAELTLSGLTSYGKQLAICDKYGLIIAANDAFIEAQITPEAMELACADFPGSGGRSANMESENGDSAIMQLHRIAAGPKRFLISSNTQAHAKTSTANTRTEPAEEEIEPQTDLSAASDISDERDDDESENKSKGIIGGVAAGVAAASSAIFGRRAHEDNDESAQKEKPAELPISVQLENEADKNDTQRQDKPSLIERSLAGNELASDEFVFNQESEPVRFAWATDTQQVFTSVSEELALAVGPNAADIVGRKWSDIAAVFGFDDSGDINELLKRQDTWSGKSVLWPVQGTDLLVPVDLAALPSFSTGRNFDGFRGFGIVRLLDSIIDPDEAGLALAGKAISEDESTTIIADERKPEKPDDILPRVEEENIEEKESKTISNIVDLNTRRENISNDPDLDNTPPLSASQLGNLSSGETKAFDEIRDRLRFSTLMGATREKRARSQAMTVDTSLLDKLPVPVIVYRDDETLYANQELLTLTGYESFVELEEAGGVNALFNCDGDEVIIDKHETCLRDKDGGKMKVKALLQSVPWDEERALQLSFRQPRHENLPANEKIVLDMMRVSELQNILDTATDGIVIVDGNGIVKSINQSAETLFGKNDSDVRENHINDLFANESHKKIATYIAEIENRNADPQMKEGDDMIGINSEGSMIPLFVTIGKIGSSDKYCAVLRDMTPWKKAREELVDARLEAENASEQKTEFLARVSHEIRTPLNAIIGFSDVMIEERFGPIDNDRYREYLRDINRSGVHVLDLINDLLDISKIEAGKMELSFESVDLNKIVGETVALLQPQANGERILIRTSLSNAVPNVVADARSIRQIVLNLVSNAIKFTQSNGQVIVSTVYEGNGEVALRVRDTGRGMSKDEVIIALKPFRQINTVGDTQKGTGLGLPLTKALVEANKAHIDIESEPGEGTIIHVQFPSQRVLAG